MSKFYEDNPAQFLGHSKLLYAAEKWRVPSALSDFPIEEKGLEYSLKSIPIGRIINMDGSFGGILTLDMRKTTHTLMVGQTGSGKTWLMQRHISISQKCGALNNIPCDLKSEMSYLRDPLQKKYHKSLITDKKGNIIEKPEGIEDMVVYHPVYLKKFSDKSVKNSTPCQFRLEDLSLEDIITMMSLSKLTDVQKTLLENAWEKYEIGDIRTFNEFMKAIEDDKEITTPAPKRFLISVLRKLVNNRVIGNEFPSPNFTQDILDGKMPILDMAGHLHAAALSNVSAAIIATNLKKLMDAKMSEVIPKGHHLICTIPEAESFVPETGEPSSKSVIINFAKKMRNYRASLFIDAQNFSNISGEVLDQCKRVFVARPGNVKLDDIYHLFKQYMPSAYSELTDAYSQQQAKSILASNLRVMNKVPHSWILMDKERSNIVMFLPFAPIGAHMGE